MLHPVGRISLATTTERPYKINHSPLSIHTEKPAARSNCCAGSVGCMQFLIPHEKTSANVQVGRPQEMPSIERIRRFINGRQHWRSSPVFVFAGSRRPLASEDVSQ